MDTRRESDPMSPAFAIDKTVAVGELRFHYRDWGGAGSPILLLHDLAGTGHAWDLVAPLLIDAYRAVALDLPGHGRSEAAADYAFQTLAADLLAVNQAIGLERPVIVGHGWGARIGLWLAAHHPHTLSGLVMVDGGVEELADLSGEQVQRQYGPDESQGIALDDFRASIQERAPQGLITPAVEAALLASYAVDGDGLVHPHLSDEAHLRILRLVWKQRLSDLYPKVACPLLVLPARRQSHDPPDRLARKARAVEGMREALPDAQVVWLEDTIHDAPLQRPHALAEHIRRFMGIVG
jgi:pimeloyl-ACP methyl ester carboxylesterase